MSETAWVCDPGETTGWSLWEFPDDAPAMRLEYGAIKGGHLGVQDWIERGNLALLRPSVVIFERFNPDLGYGKAKDYDALVTQGVVLAGARAIGVEVIYHETNMKALCTDDDLKRLGFWITPAQARVDPAILHEDARDVNDSALHAMAHAKVTGHEATVTAFWAPIVL